MAPHGSAPPPPLAISPPSRVPARYAQPLADQKPAEFTLFRECWREMPLMDIYGFPLWEKGVHDVLQRYFGALMRVYSHYCKGISGIDSAADALEMELEEFHDFIKDAKLETKLIRFDTMGVVFAKANATNTAAVCEPRHPPAASWLLPPAPPPSSTHRLPALARTTQVYEQRKNERRNATVQAGLEESARQKARRDRSPAHKRQGKPPPSYEGEFGEPADRFKKPVTERTLNEPASPDDPERSREVAGG